MPTPDVRSAESSIRPHRGDFVLRFLIDRLRFGPAAVGLTAFAFFSLLTIAINAIQGTLRSGPHVQDALFTWKWATHWTSIPMLVPILFALVVVLYRRIPRLFDELRANGVLTADGDEEGFRADLTRRLEPRHLNTILVLALIVSYAITMYVKSGKTTSCWCHPVPGQLSVAAWVFYGVFHVGAYVLIRAAFTLLVLAGTIRKVFRGATVYCIRPRAMHPDRCAGLRPLSHYVLRISFTLFVLGLMLSVFLITSYFREGSLEGMFQRVGQPLLLLTYVLLAPIAFFSPLMPAHRLMKKAKREFGSQVSDLFARRFRGVQEKVESGDVSPADVQQIKALDELSEYASSLPVWPFDVQTLTRFLATVIVPVLVPALAVAAKVFLPRLL